MQDTVSHSRGTNALDPSAGTAAYGPWSLQGYDLWVHGVSNQLALRCPSRELRQHFQRHITSQHLDVGVGSGYFLDRCTFPSDSPRVALVDLNPAALAFTQRRISRYAPTVHVGNALEPFELDEAPFTSASMMYLLHCLPGTLRDTATCFEHVRSQLRQDGVLFGATILGQGVEHNFLGRRLMEIYNQRGIFSNRLDSAAALQAELEQRFERVQLRQRGRVVLFHARCRRSEAQDAQQSAEPTCRP